jgi:histidyl-tRNA synthetase
MSERKIYKPKPISGFPEWLPEVRRVEQQWMDHIRRVFESYGYCSIETPSVEELDVLSAKGGDGGADVDKEVYVIERLHKEDGDKESRLALHFDQTVPLARYVAQHFNELVFPFKRYQMQKVWRGERPQAGRFREFYQCDIDVINVDNLPLHFDAECAAVMYEVLAGLPDVDLGRVQLRISNRKIIAGFLEEWGIQDIAAVLRILDKIEKVGEGPTFSALSKACSHTTFGENWNAANMLIGLSKIKATTSDDLRSQLDELKSRPGGPKHLEGLEELCFVLDNLSYLPKDAVVADLSIVRGLDYYTGTVYETQLLDVPEFTGSVCSGGRYDDLAGSYINKHLPGVGISIGFSRLFDIMRQTNRLNIGAKSPTQILVLLLEETQRTSANAKARQLREQGFNVEVYHAPSKIDKQFKYAEKKGVPFIYMPMDHEGTLWEIKNSETRTQKPEAEGIKDVEDFKQRRA